MTSIEIIAFGQVAAITGDTLTLNHALENTEALQQWLQQQYPALTGVKYAIAVNNKIIGEHQPLTPGQTVALLPPFSGG